MRVIHVAAVLAFVLSSGLSALAVAAASPEARAKDLVRRWVDVQNAGDVAAYGALYATTFHGMRQRQGLRVVVERDAWLRGHARLLQKKRVVKVDSIAVTSGTPRSTARLTAMTWRTSSAT